MSVSSPGSKPMWECIAETVFAELFHAAVERGSVTAAVGLVLAAAVIPLVPSPLWSAVAFGVALTAMFYVCLRLR